MSISKRDYSGEELRTLIDNSVTSITQPGSSIQWNLLGPVLAPLCSGDITAGTKVAVFIGEIIDTLGITISMMKGGVWDYFWNSLAYTVNNVTNYPLESASLMYLFTSNLIQITKENEITNNENYPHYKELFDQGYWGAQYANYKNYENTALTPPHYDPLVLDLNKDGSISPNSSVYFDYDGDGVKELGSWFFSDDGLLVIDKNGDGIINDGTELFGDSMLKSNGSKALNGMDALKDFV